MSGCQLANLGRQIIGSSVSSLPSKEIVTQDASHKEMRDEGIADRGDDTDTPTESAGGFIINCDFERRDSLWIKRFYYLASFLETARKSNQKERSQERRWTGKRNDVTAEVEKKLGKIGFQERINSVTRFSSSPLFACCLICAPHELRAVPHLELTAGSTCTASRAFVGSESID